MNATLRALKGALAVLSLAGLGLLLRWMTAGSISGLRTYDLDSLTVLAVGTIAWIAYGWLVVAVVLTVLEQLPGAVGTLAGAVAGRITTRTARALLRSGLGVAAVTPLTVGVAQAAPGDTAHVRQWNQSDPQSAAQLTSTDFRATEPRSTVQLSNTPHRTTPPASHIETDSTHTTYRSTEPASRVEISATQPRSDYRSTEPASRVEIGGSEAGPKDQSGYRSTEPASTVRLGGTEADLHRTSSDSAAARQHTDNFRSTEPRSTVELGNSGATTRPTGDRTQPGVPDRPTDDRARPEVPSRPTGERARPGVPTGDRARPEVPNRPTSDRTGVPSRPAGGRARLGVPDRPTAGAPTRYTDLRPAVPVRVVVREGDSLWSIAARELGRGATTEAITARWPDWYAANRHVIGDNPDLIFPGQVLRIPTRTTSDHLPPQHEEQ